MKRERAPLPQPYGRPRWVPVKPHVQGIAAVRAAWLRWLELLEAAGPDPVAPEDPAG